MILKLKNSLKNTLLITKLSISKKYICYTERFAKRFKMCLKLNYLIISINVE